MTKTDYRSQRTEPLAQEAYVAFVQICKGGSDDAGTYDADEAIVRRALKRLDELEGAALAEPELEGPTHRITPDDFRRWWRETDSASPAPAPEMLLTANAWAQYCLDRWGNSQGILDTSTASSRSN